MYIGYDGREAAQHQSSTIGTLIARSEKTFFTCIEPRQQALLEMSQIEAICEVGDDIGQACDSVLDEKKLGFRRYTALLLQCCMEDSSLFTEQPQAYECVVHIEDRQVTALHCVYHNLYALLHAMIEQEFEDWHYSNQPEEAEANT